jgi:hypothetical protein
MCRVELAELEPSARGTKKGHYQQIISPEEIKDVNISDDVVIDNECDIGTTLHGEGLAKTRKELFAVQHQGSYGIFVKIQSLISSSLQNRAVFGA